MVFYRADDTNMEKGEGRGKQYLPSGGYGCPNGRKFIPNEMELKMPFRWNGWEAGSIGSGLNPEGVTVL